MIKCVVEMWGLPREVSGLPEVEIQLQDGAKLKDLVAGLRESVPSLDGVAILKDEDKLDDGCAFNLHGQFYQNDNSVKLKDGDRVRLLTLATGG